jgi:competence protein ComEA
MRGDSAHPSRQDCGMSDLPPQRIVLIVIAAVAVLAIGYRSMGSGDPPRAAYTGLPAAPAAPASAAVVVVDVVGAVREPGVYRFPDGARMQDAVKRARPLPGADLAGLNLAERLADGEQVVVPRRGAGGAAVVSSASGAAGSEIVHLNSATLEQLETLDGIGP